MSTSRTNRSDEVERMAQENRDLRRLLRESMNREKLLRAALTPGNRGAFQVLHGRS
jgi:hypothetical protein